MKSKSRKLLAAFTVMAIAVSMCTGVSAESLPDGTYSKDKVNDKSAVLNYDTENGTYELLDENGNNISGEFTEEKELPAVKYEDSEAPAEAEPVPAVTTVPEGAQQGEAVTGTETTTVTSDTRKWYTAEYRVDVMAKISSNNAKTTKKTTKTTTSTTAVKKVYDGIDVSRYQGDINWTKVKAAGIDFVMIRAGYGKLADQVDSKFKTNIAGAQKAGIDCGVYWYSYAVNTADALQEAKTCYNTVKGYKLSYPIAFDIEDSSQANLTATQISNITKVFCDYIESQKCYVIIYSFSSFLNNKMNSSVTSKYDIWVAHINAKKPSYNGNYGMWQYSHTGKVNGISTVVDLDYSYCYYPDIMKKNKLNGYK